MPIEAFRCGPMDNGVYVVYDADHGVATIVDPSFDSEPAWRFVERYGLRLEAIVNTHGHFDHVVENGLWAARAPDAPRYLHPADAHLLAGAAIAAARFGLTAQPSPPPTHAFVDGQELTFGGTPWRIAHVPGHSPGSICLIADQVVIGGDVLFRGSVGRTDLPGGDHDLLIAGIRATLLILPESTTVYPGHGSETTIGEERRHNPYLR